MGIFKKKQKFSGRAGQRKRKINLMNLKPGDSIEYDGDEYNVISKIIYTEGGDQWYEYLLKCEGEKYWLQVEQDDELLVSFFEEIKKSLPDPMPVNIEHDGVSYELDEHGKSRISKTTLGGEKKEEEVEYWDYEDETEELIFSVEKWGDYYEVHVGEYLDPWEITIYPSEQN